MQQHCVSLCVSLFYQVVLFLSLCTVWRSCALPCTKYLGNLTDVCFCEMDPQWTQGEAQNGWNVKRTSNGWRQSIFSLWEQERDRWLGVFQYNRFSAKHFNFTERPDSLNWKCFTKKHLLLWPFSRTQASCHWNPPVYFSNSVGELATLVNQRLHDFWTPWSANTQAALPFCVPPAHITH